jgi:hypothetical protein
MTITQEERYRILGAIFSEQDYLREEGLSLADGKIMMEGMPGDIYAYPALGNHDCHMVSYKSLEEAIAIVDSIDFLPKFA